MELKPSAVTTYLEKRLVITVRLSEEAINPHLKAHVSERRWWVVHVAVTTTPHAPESFNHHVLPLCDDYSHMSKQDDFSWNESTYQELEDTIIRNPDYFEVKCLDEDCYLNLQYIDVIERIESYHLED